MRVLDLFSGIGGFSVGLERAGMQTIAFCEIHPFRRKVLRKHWPESTIHHDITKLDGRKYRGKIDLICGGFPCQPYSIAGRKQGTEDHRDLWPHMRRIIEQAQPTWVIGENVANFTNMAFTRTKVDLENLGYEVLPFEIPACAVGAPHKRARIWILAYRLDIPNGAKIHGERCKARSRKMQSRRDTWWDTEPGVDRVADGIPNGVDRIEALGDTVLPQIPEILGRAILAFSRDNKGDCP